jgi:hypothetical protein
VANVELRGFVSPVERHAHVDGGLTRIRPDAKVERRQLGLNIDDAAVVGLPGPSTVELGETLPGDVG